MTRKRVSAPWALFDVDITRCAEALRTGPKARGMGILMRHGRKPVAFVMVPTGPGAVLCREDMMRMAHAKAGRIIAENLVLAELNISPPEKPPSISVAVCTHDRPEKLARCLGALSRIRWPDGFERSRMEILVVDNAPPDHKTRDVTAASKQLPCRVRYVREDRPGLDFARNRALTEASGEMVAYLDDDVTVDACWLEGFIEAWGENPDAAAFTGPVLPLALDTGAQILFEARGGFGRGFQKVRYGRTLPGNSVYPCGPGIFGTGCNMTFRKSVLSALGGFDEALDRGAPLPGGGDLDIFYRVVRSGFPLVYEPGFMVFHEHRREMDALRHQFFTWGLGFMAFVWKNWNRDKNMRKSFFRLVAWWFRDQLRRLVFGVPEWGPFPAVLTLAETAGGLVGLSGAYPRSRKGVRGLERPLR